MVHLAPSDKAIFALRDPSTRFVSSFYGRLHKGKPRYEFKWTARERLAFEWFDTPRALADALAESRGRARQRAIYSMWGDRHVNRPATHWIGKPADLHRNLGKVLYVARQETLAEDWERIKELLGLEREIMLPDDDFIAHRTAYTGDRTLSDKGMLALRKWYADDYELLAMAEALREGRAPAAPAIHRRAVAAVANMRPKPKFTRARPANWKKKRGPLERLALLRERLRARLLLAGDAIAGRSRS